MVSRSNGLRNTKMTCSNPAARYGSMRHRDVIRGAAGVEVVAPGPQVVRVAPRRPGGVRLVTAGAHDDVEVRRPLDLPLVASGRRTRLPQDRVGGGERVRGAVGVPDVRVACHQGQRLARPGPADQDRQPRLDRTRLAHGVVHPVEAAVVRHPLAVEQPPDQRHRLPEPVEPLAETGAEVDPEGVVLALEPAAADAQDRAAAADVVEGRRELGRQAGVAEGVGRDEQADPRPGGHGRDRGQRRPALELGVAPVALVGEQVVVEPEVVEAGGLGPDDGVAKLRPAGPLDPERRAEAHRHRSPPRPYRTDVAAPARPVPRPAPAVEPARRSRPRSATPSSPGTTRTAAASPSGRPATRTRCSCRS